MSSTEFPRLADWWRITQQIGDAMLIESAERRLTVVNDAFCRMFSIPVHPDDMIGADCREALHQVKGLFAEPDREIARVDDILRDRLPVMREEISMADGRVVERDYVPVFDGDVYAGHVWIYRDRTEARRMEEELRQQAALRGAILASALDAIVTIDQHGNIVEFNPAAEQMFGYRYGDVVGKPMYEFIIPPEYRAAHNAGMAEYFRSGAGPVLNRRIEVTGYRSDGTRFPIEIAIVPVNEGPSVHFTAYLRDISERKAFIDQLANDERAARAVSETAVWLLDEESTEGTLGRVLAHVGKAIDADRGHIYVLHEIGGERDAGVALRHAWSAEHDDAELDVEARAPRVWDPVFRRWFELLKSGTPIVGWAKDLPEPERIAIESIGVVSFAIVPIFVDQEYWGSLGFDDTRLGRSWSETEITILRTLASTIGAAVKRQRLSAALLHRERLATLGTITSSVAHELNSPLGAILNSAERLAADPNTSIDATSRRNLLLIEKAALRSKLVIERLLATSHDSASPAASAYPWLVIEDCIELYGKHIELHGITVRVHKESTRRVAMGSTELSQLVTNLLFNARDAVVDISEEPRDIVITVRDVGSMVELSVKDSGPGITEQARLRAFDAFYTTKDSGSGTGLGLWICRRLVNEAGGSISLTNTGSGTRAVAMLPSLEDA